MKKPSVKVMRKDLLTLIHFLKLTHRIDKTFVTLLILSGVFKSLTPLINIIMPKFIIDELWGDKRIEVFIYLVLIIIVGNGLLSLINKTLESFIKTKNLKILKGFDLIMGEKIMDLDFEKIEDPEILNLKELAMQPIKQQGAITRVINSFVDVISQSITILTLAGIISTMSPMIILIIISIVLLNSSILKKIQKKQYEFYESLIPINREAIYYYSLAEDFSVGKDIRLYNMSPFITKKITTFNDKAVSCMEGLFSKISHYNGIINVFAQFQFMFVYGYIAYKAIKNLISLGDFALYTNAAIKFSASVGIIFNTYVTITQMCRYLENFIKVESISTENPKAIKPLEYVSKYTIEFKNVSFKYPRSEEYALKNINITIESGEKLSVVGLNGAGKTTFIKLLCRLYKPTDGEIFLNGVNIADYSYNDYIDLLSVVFQDFKLLSLSIKENIALYQSELAADVEVEKVTHRAGFEKDLNNLDKGIYTVINKTFDKEGIEFSGGQSQKLAIARAIYKDSPIIILDEPTAALDPYAEFEIYSKFNELVGEKTAIYISHRLSSCKFCDNIAVFKDGEIVEYGTHQKLVKENGLYSEMYEVQAQYYV